MHVGLLSHREVASGCSVELHGSFPCETKAPNW